MDKRKKQQPELFKERMVPADPGSGQLFKTVYETDAAGPVECLGQTFPNDTARREHFRQLLKAKLQDPAFRKNEGFPDGKDEDILNLSDPPYYTPCPNPFLEEFIKHHGKPYDTKTDSYKREPFAVDVSEGRTDPIYAAHSYHTKVPHKAIMRAILHYTEPGDLVLDGFCGTGMTGVAAQMCGCPDPQFKTQIEAEGMKAGFAPPKWAPRRAILNDLSPIATFIAANYNIPFNIGEFEAAARGILDEMHTEIGWMYETLHTDGKTKGAIEYTVWSEVFSCPECGHEIVFVEEALDPKTKEVRGTFPCPKCKAMLTKDNLQRIFESFVDPATKSAWKRIKFIPVIVCYKVGKKRFEKKPDDSDRKILKKIDGLPFPTAMPTDEFPIEKMSHGSRIAPKGFTRVHHFFLPRAAQSLGIIWSKIDAIEDVRTRNVLRFFGEQAIWTASLLNRYRPTGYSQVNQYISGVYYIPSQHAECTPWYILEGKLDRLVKAFSAARMHDGRAVVTTGTAAKLGISDASIDYIFTDPPFGENISYADLNFLVEAWHGVRTQTDTEAIVDEPKGKDIFDYERLMRDCFVEYYRVLKPGRWMTVVFHNSWNAVWSAIQEALQSAGFVIADVRTLDRQQGSYRQVTSIAVKQDLIISTYKPNGGLETRFKLEAGTEEGVWDFVRTHLKQLPVFVEKDGRAEMIVERQNYLLFDRMVAFHVQHGVTVPLSAAEFYAGLTQRFAERDGMFFLPEQVADYDKKRMTVKEVLQLDLFVSDEASAIQWLKQQLLEKPQTFQELHPQFMKEIGGWQKHERPLELSTMLEENFICYDGNGEVPNAIHSYLSTNFKDLRKLAKDAPALRAKAKDRWHVPDPNKATEREKLRERGLLREFEEYRASAQRRLKVFRLEAVRAGFKKAWQDKDYKTIIEVAGKIPEAVLQEDQKLLMWFDQAMTRTGAE